MTRPTTLPHRWATDANFGSGPANALPTKVDPGNATLAQGMVPGVEVEAEYLNFLLHNHGEWATYRGLQLDRNLIRVLINAAHNFYDVAYGVESGVPRWLVVGDDNANGAAVYYSQSSEFDLADMVASTVTGANPKRCAVRAGSTWYVGADTTAGADNILIVSGTTYSNISTTVATADNIRLNAAGTDGTNAVFVGRDTTGDQARVYRQDGTFTAIAVNELHDLEYAASIWVAVGENAAGTGPAIYTSTDRTSWAARTSPGTEILRGVCHDGTVFVAYGDDGEIITSTDGITWTLRSAAGTGSASDQRRRIAADPTSGLILWRDEGGEAIKQSIDHGVSWSTLIRGGGGSRAFSFGGDRFAIPTVLGTCLFSR